MTRALTIPIGATPSVRRLAGEQLGVAAGQLAAGAGNLLFALVAARIMAPAAFAELAAFLALYLVIHVPAAALSAGGALAPERVAALRRRTLAGGAIAGAVLAASTPVLVPALDLAPELLLLAALSAPTAGLIALERGRLYGRGLHARAVGSLLAEPGLRLALGVATAAVLGPAGGAAAVVVAGWAALAVAEGGERRPEPAGESRGGALAGGAVATFLALALVQSLDVLLAGALLDGADAGRFAVLSTLGGAAAFATTTIPLVLLPRSAAGDPRALAAALAAAVALGAAAVALVALAPDELVGTVFGERYSSVGELAVPYLVAMALLGLARVLFAQLSLHSPRLAPAMLSALVVVHAALLVVLGDDPAGLVRATLISTAAATATGAALVLLRPRAREAEAEELAPAPVPARRTRVSRTAVAITGFTLAGLVLRLLANRGIWLDEATSIAQTRLPLDEMLERLRSTDVHPPLHHIVLWGWTRVAGSGELAVRAPSLLASTALVPLLFYAGRDIYGRRAGVAAAGLIALAPFAIWYAQEARMYALFMLFAFVAVWAQLRVLRDGRGRDWAIYAVATAAMVYTQYFAVLLVAVQQAAFALALLDRGDRRRLLLGWLASGVAIALALAPLVPFALDQFAANEAAGKGFQQVPTQAGGELDGERPAVYSVITNGVWALWGYHSDATMTAMAALWPLGMLLCLALLGRRATRATLLLAACALLPAIALFLAGQLKPFVFEVRYFSAAVPIGVLLLARALTAWTRTRATTAVVAGLVAVSLAAGLADQQLNGSNPRQYDFEGALDLISERARPGDVVVYSPSYLNDVVGYHAPDLRARPIGRGVPEPRRGRGVFLLGSFLDKPGDREATAAAVRDLDRKGRLVDTARRPQIRIWEFRR